MDGSLGKPRTSCQPPPPKIPWTLRECARTFFGRKPPNSPHHRIAPNPGNSHPKLSTSTSSTRPHLLTHTSSIPKSKYPHQAQSHSSHLSPSLRRAINSQTSPLATNTYPRYPMPLFLHPSRSSALSHPPPKPSPRNITTHITKIDNTPCHVMPIPFQFRYLSNNPMNA